jgi:hypothetical protein
MRLLNTVASFANYGQLILCVRRVRSGVSGGRRVMTGSLALPLALDRTRLVLPFTQAGDRRHMQLRPDTQDR